MLFVSARKQCDYIVRRLMCLRLGVICLKMLEKMVNRHAHPTFLVANPPADFLAPLHVRSLRTYINRVCRPPRHLVTTTDCVQFLIVHVTLRANPFLGSYALCIKTPKSEADLVSLSL